MQRHERDGDACEPGGDLPAHGFAQELTGPRQERSALAHVLEHPGEPGARDERNDSGAEHDSGGDEQARTARTRHGRSQGRAGSRQERSSAEHDVDGRQHQERGHDRRDRRARHRPPDQDDLGRVTGVRRRHRVAGDAGQVRAQHRAPRHARVGPGGLQEVRPGAGMTDGSQQLACDGHDEQTPVDVIEAANTSPDGIHGALAHSQSMPHRG